MAEEGEVGTLTLEAAKAWLSERFGKYEIQAAYIKKPGKLVQAKSVGRFVFGIEVAEKRPNRGDIAFSRRRNFRLYVYPKTEDQEVLVQEDEANKDCLVEFEETQGPLAEAAEVPTLPLPGPTFKDEVVAYLDTELKEERIELYRGVVTYDEIAKATAIVIDHSKQEKAVIIRKVEDNFVMDTYTPLTE